ncbi:hypothetical protein [Streptomyces sp. VRA16 Mangrove soil]|uniref:hypothetical protein n=1 Tax=Streptomyces sp. VRA16 Mangrove soil TaxID=2817434 RepID=UPI001E633841|nr:hypothetical protein [Streptomyces sp. VRA16 Mangrove soil]
MRKSMKAYALGAAVAAALTVTACGPGGSDDKADGSASPSASTSASASASASAGASPSQSASSTPSRTASASTTGSAGGNGGASGGSGSKDWDYADRQTPPTGSVCDHDGQGPYGKIEGLAVGGETPYATLDLVLGMYQCDGEGPTFVPSSATGAATTVAVDSNHLKVVVGGRLASDLGTKTPKANAFFDELGKLDSEGGLKGAKAPEFYFRVDSASDDVNVMPDDSTHIIYLYQIIDGD